MLTFFPYPFLAGCALLIPVAILTWRRQHSRLQLFFLSLFWFYLLLVLNATLFPIFPANDWRQPVSDILAHINLRPLYFGGLFGLYPHIARLEILGNILLTVPLGFLTPLVVKINLRRLAWLLLIGGLGFETGQLLINLAFGGAFRSVDINDVILNTTGTLVGYGLFNLFAGIYRLITKHHPSPVAGLRGFLWDVTRRK